MDEKELRRIADVARELNRHLDTSGVREAQARVAAIQASLPSQTVLDDLARSIASVGAPDFSKLFPMQDQAVHLASMRALLPERTLQQTADSLISAIRAITPAVGPATYLRLFDATTSLGKAAGIATIVDQWASVPGVHTQFADLAEMFKISTPVLNVAMAGILDRFPEGFPGGAAFQEGLEEEILSPASTLATQMYEESIPEGPPDQARRVALNLWLHLASQLMRLELEPILENRFGEENFMLLQHVWIWFTVVVMALAAAQRIHGRDDK